MNEVQLAKLQLFNTIFWMGAIGVIIYANYLSIKVNKRELAKPV